MCKRETILDIDVFKIMNDSCTIYENIRNFMLDDFWAKKLN